MIRHISDPASILLQLRAALARLADANHRAFELLRDAIGACLALLGRTLQDAAEHARAFLPF